MSSGAPVVVVDELEPSEDEEHPAPKHQADDREAGRGGAEREGKTSHRGP